ncbi:MAG: 2,5-diamino-6-(ribosylamino)-4(3H)-pyrimidinone 5'-phosphate reductase [Chloroflexi bacterium]|nr:2,5-diamino-6-(ribosylamino)-4(3H)-pyrimidinone 5'-phosphate reductase [Chloroflexota bacterium]
MSIERPYVILNAAVTADGKTDTIARQGAAISSPLDLARVDRLRAGSDAIMVGGRTLLGDDPRLIVKTEALRAERRARGLDENPIKVGVVTNANTLRLDGRFMTFGPARRIVFTTDQTDQAQVERLREREIEVVVLGAQRVDLTAALHYLKQAGVQHLLVEGGGVLNAELLRKNLVDEIHLYIAPLIFGGVSAPTFVSGDGWLRDEALQLQLAAVERVDDGIVVHYVPQTV